MNARMFIEQCGYDVYVCAEKFGELAVFENVTDDGIRRCVFDGLWRWHGHDGNVRHVAYDGLR